MNDFNNTNLSRMDSILAKSVDNSNQAISMLSKIILKNETLQNNSMIHNIVLEKIKKQLENINGDIKSNYPEDRLLSIKISKTLESQEIKEAIEVVQDIRVAMNLMKLISANITSFSGDPELWYRFTEIISKLENKAHKLD